LGKNTPLIFFLIFPLFAITNKYLVNLQLKMAAQRSGMSATVASAAAFGVAAGPTFYSLLAAIFVDAK
jgi:hypothetical protein